MTPSSHSVPPTGPQRREMRPADLNLPLALLIALCAGFLLFGLAFITTSLVDLFKSLEAKSWPQVPASVLEAHLSQHKAHDGAEETKVVVRFRYEMNGQSFEGVNTAPAFWLSKRETLALQHLNHLKPRVGNPPSLSASVNPSDPSEAVLFPELPLGPFLATLLGGALFCLLGAGMGHFAVGGLLRWRALMVAHPDEPWLHDREWAAGVVECEHTELHLMLGFVGLVFIAATSLLPTAFLRELSKQPPNYSVLLALLVPLVGVTLVIVAVKVYKNQRRFGKGVLRLHDIPFRFGKEAHGTLILMSSIVQAVKELEVALICEEITITRDISGRSEPKVRRIFEGVSRAAVSESMIRGQEAHIPIVVVPPLSGLPTGKVRPKVTIKWSLCMRAEIPGLDFRLRFRVSMF